MNHPASGEVQPGSASSRSVISPGVTASDGSALCQPNTSSKAAVSSASSRSTIFSSANPLAFPAETTMPLHDANAEPTTASLITSNRDTQDVVMDGLDQSIHNPTNRPAPVEEPLTETKKILSREIKAKDFRAILEFDPREIIQDVAISYGSLFTSDNKETRNAVEVRLILDTAGIVPSLKFQLKSPTVPGTKHISVGFTASCTSDLAFKRATRQDWQPRPTSVPSERAEEFYAGIDRGDYASISFEYIPAAEPLRLRFERVQAELTNIRTDEEYVENPLFARLMKELRQRFNSDRAFRMRFLVRHTDNRCIKAMTVLQRRFREELEYPIQPSYLRYFFKKVRCWSLDFRAIEEIPVIIKDKIKDSYTSSTEMWTRILAGACEQFSADISVADAIWEEMASMKAICYPKTKPVQYHVLIQFTSANPPRLPPSTRVRLIFGTALVEVAVDLRKDDGDEADLSDVVQPKGWPGTVLTPTIWQPEVSIMVAVDRPRVKGRLVQDRIQAYTPTPDDTTSSPSELFEKTEAVPVKLIAEVSNKTFKRIRRAVGIMMDGGRHGEACRLYEDEIDDWFDKHDGVLTDMPPKLLVNYRRAQRDGLFVPDEYVRWWSSYLLMQDTTTGVASDLLSQEARQELFDQTDPDQRDVIDLMSNAPATPVIHGLPGTGKTTLMARIIRAKAKSEASKRERAPLVVVASSNSAVDVIVQRLNSQRGDDEKHLFYIRLHGLETEQGFVFNAQMALEGPAGPDEDMSEEIIEHEILGLIELERQRREARRSQRVAFGRGRRANVNDVRFKRPADSLAYLILRIAAYDGFESCKYTTPGDWQAFREVVAMKARRETPSKELEKQYKVERTLILDYALRLSAAVVTTVSNMAAKFLVRNLGNVSKLCFMDEAGLTTMAELAIVVAHYSFDNIILLGDPMQLAPVNKAEHHTAPTDRPTTGQRDATGSNNDRWKHASVCAAEACRSPLSYLLSNSVKSTRLRIQRRAIAGLMALSNKLCYEGMMEDHKILSLPERHMTSKRAANVIKVMFDLSFMVRLPPAIIMEVEGIEQTDSTNSKHNVENVCVGVNILRALLADINIYDNYIAVICTYKAQVVRYKRKIEEVQKIFGSGPSTHDLSKVDIDVVDKFQGSERKIILVDLVATDEIGFLREINRLNVALTRGKDFTIILGRSDLLRNKNMATNPVYWIMGEGAKGYPHLKVARNHQLLQANPDFDVPARVRELEHQEWEQKEGAAP